MKRIEFSLTGGRGFFFLWECCTRILSLVTKQYKEFKDNSLDSFISKLILSSHLEKLVLWSLVSFLSIKILYLRAKKT